MLKHLFQKLEKVVFTLTDAKLSNVRDLPNKIYFKAKTSKKESYTSEQVSLVNREVVWNDVVTVRGKVARNGAVRRPKPLKLSFRIVAENKDKFVRYGYVKIDASKMFTERENSVFLSLTKCRDNAVFTCNLKVDTVGDNNTAITGAYHSDIGRGITRPYPSMVMGLGEYSVSTFMSTLGTESTSTSIVKEDSYNTCPFKCSREEYAKLENVVDAVLGRVIADVSIA